jgi:hypothetical protein
LNYSAAVVKEEEEEEETKEGAGVSIAVFLS